MKAFLLFFIVIVVLASYPFFNEEKKDAVPVTGLPWQIELHKDGSTSVFGLHVGHDTLADAVHKLGVDMELAVIAASDESGSLEMYYGHYRAGLLSGKLVLQTDVDASVIERWRNNAIKTDYMATGKARKFILSEQDRAIALNAVIVAVTFLPAVNLDEEVITARFGRADQRIEKNGVTHFLFAEKGLDIALYEESKEVLQYVEPKAFSKLSLPLQQ